MKRLFYFYAKEFFYNRFFNTDASPRIFDTLRFFEEHKETISHKVAQSLHGGPLVMVTRLSKLNAAANIAIAKLQPPRL